MDKLTNLSLDRETAASDTDVDTKDFVSKATPRLAYGDGLRLSPGTADTYDLYEDELTRVRAALPAEMQEYLAGFSPRAVPQPRKESATAFVARAITGVAPLNKHTATQASAALVHITTWAHLVKGLPLKYQLILSSEVIARWQRAALADMTLGEGTVRNYRGHLARIAHALGVAIDSKFDPITRTARAQPYSSDDLQRFLLWSRTLTPIMRTRALALVTLGAGAGLETAEILGVRARDVLSEGGMWVRVTGENSRITPTLENWRPRLRALVDGMSPDDLVFPRSDVEPTSTLMKGWLHQHDPKKRPVPKRLRTSRIVEMLRTEPDDAKTLIYSGIERGETLAGYLPFLAEVDRARRAAMLRLRNSATPEQG